MNEPSLVQLIEQFQQSSPDAAEELWRRYSPCIMRVVRRHLTRSLRRVSDTQDFVQAVWKTIFEHADRLAQFDSPDRLGAYLAQVAANKVVSASRAQGAQKRDDRRCESLGEPLADSLVSPDPSPSQHVMGRELYAEITGGLGTAHREIVDLRIDGNTCDQIAAQLGIHERTVRRVLDRLAEQRE